MSAFTEAWRKAIAKVVILGEAYDDLRDDAATSASELARLAAHVRDAEANGHDLTDIADDLLALADFLNTSATRQLDLKDAA